MVALTYAQRAGASQPKGPNPTCIIGALRGFAALSENRADRGTPREATRVRTHIKTDFSGWSSRWYRCDKRRRRARDIPEEIRRGIERMRMQRNHSSATASVARPPRELARYVEAHTLDLFARYSAHPKKNDTQRGQHTN